MTTLEILYIGGCTLQKFIFQMKLEFQVFNMILFWIKSSKFFTHELKTP